MLMCAICLSAYLGQRKTERVHILCLGVREHSRSGKYYSTVLTLMCVIQVYYKMFVLKIDYIELVVRVQRHSQKF